MFERDTVTLSYQGSLVRVLVAHGSEVRLWQSVTIPETILREGNVLDSEAMSVRLADLFEEHRLSKRRIVTAISGQRSIFRTLSLPPMDEDLIDEAVHRKVRQEIPMPNQETDLSFEVVSQSDAGIEVFVIAVPRSVIDNQVEPFVAAGLRPKALDVGPLALVRAVNHAQALIVNLESFGLSVIVVQNRLPAIVRTVPLGAQSASADGRLDLLIQELARTTKFYNESHRENPVPDGTAVYLTGSGFRSAAVRERFASRVPYPSMQPAPPLELPKELSIPEFSVNLGLALKKL
ncbi:MAG: pilus assembly protein PilM [Anaerolineales bacterium]